MFKIRNINLFHPCQLNSNLLHIAINDEVKKEPRATEGNDRNFLKDDDHSLILVPIPFRITDLILYYKHNIIFSCLS